MYSFTGTYPSDTYLDVYQGSTYVGGDHFYSSFNIFCTLEENTQYTVSFRDKYPDTRMYGSYVSICVEAFEGLIWARPESLQGRGRGK